jgi:hypothetical protein
MRVFFSSVGDEDASLSTDGIALSYRSAYFEADLSILLYAGPVSTVLKYVGGLELLSKAVESLSVSTVEASASIADSDSSANPPTGANAGPGDESVPEGKYPTELLIGALPAPFLSRSFELWGNILVGEMYKANGRQV